jgi:hypothetical protein
LTAQEEKSAGGLTLCSKFVKEEQSCVYSAGRRAWWRFQYVLTIHEEEPTGGFNPRSQARKKNVLEV